MPRIEWIGWILLVLGLSRAAFLVAQQPMLGYANQFDMVRTSACIGLYPDLPEPAHLQASPAAPLPLYRAGPRIEGGCYLAAEVAIVAVAVKASAWIRGTGDTMPLRHVGLAKWGLLALAALAIGWALHAHPLAALLHGLVVFVVMADPVVTLWLNTLYTEFATLWGVYAAIGTLCALALTDRGAYVNAALLVLALATLGFAREQFALLSPVLVLLAWPWLWARSSHLTVGAFGVALVAAIVSFLLLPRPPEIQRANRIDAYLGILVPAAADPQAALRTLGLPARCAPVVGATAYLRRGEVIEQECPEVFALSSVAFLRFAREDPAVLARAAARVLPALQAPSPAYVGIVAGRDGAGIRDLPPWHASLVDAVLAPLPFPFHALLVLAAVLAAPLAFLAALGLARPARGVQAAPLLLAMLLGATVAYALGTTVYGDGLGEAARHFLPGNVALVAALLALAVGVPAAAARWWRDPGRHRIEMGVAFVAALVLAVACVASLRWARTQPLAIGVLDEPLGREVPRGGAVLRGWALDPFGVEAIELELGANRRTVPFGGAVKAGLAPLYPAYPDAARAAFAVELAAADLAAAFPEGAGELAVKVRNSAGATTQVERRRLRLAP
jgi:hypothetical protein